MTFTWDLPTSISTFKDMFVYLNTATTGIGMTIVLFVAMIIAYLTLSRFSNNDAFLATSVLGLFLAIPLFYAGLVTSLTLFIVFGLLVLAVLNSFIFD